MHLLLFSLLTLSCCFACPFCDPKVLEAQSFYQDDKVIALIPYKPIIQGHALIIPKRHVASFEELTRDEIASIGETIQKVHFATKELFQTPSYILHQKNGLEAGQSVFHLHFHYLPKKEGDSSYLKLFYNILLAHLRGPLPPSKISLLVDPMKAAIAKTTQKNGALYDIKH